MLCIRFHYGGWFQRVGSTLSYLGGDIGESWIDLDKVSFLRSRGIWKITTRLTMSSGFIGCGHTWI